MAEVCYDSQSLVSRALDIFRERGATKMKKKGERTTSHRQDENLIQTSKRFRIMAASLL